MASTELLSSTGVASLTGGINNLGEIDVRSGTLTADFSAGSGGGKIDIAAGATLVATGIYALSALGDVTGAGVLDLGGTILDAGQTLDLATGTPEQAVVLSGTLVGGALTQHGGTLLVGSRIARRHRSRHHRSRHHGCCRGR